MPPGAPGHMGFNRDLTRLGRGQSCAWRILPMSGRKASNRAGPMPAPAARRDVAARRVAADVSPPEVAAHIGSLPVSRERGAERRAAQQPGQTLGAAETVVVADEQRPVEDRNVPVRLRRGRRPTRSERPAAPRRPNAGRRPRRPAPAARRRGRRHGRDRVTTAPRQPMDRDEDRTDTAPCARAQRHRPAAPGPTRARSARAPTPRRPRPDPPSVARARAARRRA